MATEMKSHCLSCGDEVEKGQPYCSKCFQPTPNWKYPVVCICGSTRFKKETLEMAEKLSIEGHVILMVNCWNHADAFHEPQNEKDKAVKAMLDDMHLQKIRMSDYVLVMNIGGYIGKSTKAEIEYAKKIGKPIKWIEKHDS